MYGNLIEKILFSMLIIARFAEIQVNSGKEICNTGIYIQMEKNQ